MKSMKEEQAATRQFLHSPFDELPSLLSTLQVVTAISRTLSSGENSYLTTDKHAKESLASVTSRHMKTQSPQVHYTGPIACQPAYWADSTACTNTRGYTYCTWPPTDEQDLLKVGEPCFVKLSSERSTGRGVAVEDEQNGPDRIRVRVECCLV